MIHCFQPKRLQWVIKSEQWRLTQVLIDIKYDVSHVYPTDPIDPLPPAHRGSARLWYFMFPSHPQALHMAHCFLWLGLLLKCGAGWFEVSPEDSGTRSPGQNPVIPLISCVTLDVSLTSFRSVFSSVKWGWWNLAQRLTFWVKLQIECFDQWQNKMQHQ